MKTTGFPKPVNATQSEFRSLCEKGGGASGGPPRTKVQELLKHRGQRLNEFAYEEIGVQMEALADRNPWHVCFAVGMSWGHLAKLDLTFSEAAVNLLEDWNDEDLKVARKFHLDRGPNTIEETLKGGSILFSTVNLPSMLPDSVLGIAEAQKEWLKPISFPATRPKFIGEWNATAMFMVALFAQPELAKSYRELSVVLPPGGPISNALNLLHKAHILKDPPDGSSLDDGPFESGRMFTKNANFVDLLKGLADCSLIDIHSGLYMLGTRLPESKQWD